MNEQRKGKDFDKMIVESVKKNYSFFAWHSLGGVIEKCEFKIKAYRKDYNELEFEVKPGQEEALSRIISGNRVLNFYVPDLSVSFSTELKNVSSEKKVKVYLPADYTFYERRKHERLEPSKPCFVSLELNKALMKKTIFDISLGGIAFILPKSDKVVIAKGKAFPLLILDIEGRKIKVKAECVAANIIDRFKVESLPYGGCKIAFRFTAISAEDREYLVQYIAHQTLLKQQFKKAY